MTITSSHNDRLKELRRLAGRRRAREQAGRFVAEGEDLLDAAEAANWPAVERYRAAGTGPAGPGWTEVEPALLDEASGLGSGTRVLGIYEARWAPRASGPLCVALWGLSDPGNVGTILRGAVAFGAASVAVGPGCADPFSPKAVRASMGAIFGVRLARCATLAELPGETVALDAGARNAEPLGDLVPAGEELTLIVGSERDGLPAEVLEGADRVARIPIATHSLNAAMAATVGLYEASRRMARGS